MKELTVALDEEQIERIEEESRRLGIPSDEVVQRAVDSYLGVVHVNGTESKHPILGFIGLGRSGRSDISSRMEELLDEEWGEWTLRGEDPPTLSPDTMRDSEGKPGSAP